MCELSGTALRSAIITKPPLECKAKLLPTCMAETRVRYGSLSYILHTFILPYTFAGCRTWLAAEIMPNELFGLLICKPLILRWSYFDIIASSLRALLW